MGKRERIFKLENMESKFRIKRIPSQGWVVEEFIRGRSWLTGTFLAGIDGYWTSCLKYRGSDDAYPYVSKQRAMKRLLKEIKMETEILE